MKITDIKEYLKAEKEKRQGAEGMTCVEFAEELEISLDAAKRFVYNEVRLGHLKENGKRPFPEANGGVRYKPVYILVPHDSKETPKKTVRRK